MNTHQLNISLSDDDGASASVSVIGDGGMAHVLGAIRALLYAADFPEQTIKDAVLSPEAWENGSGIDPVAHEEPLTAEEVNELRLLKDSVDYARGLIFPFDFSLPHIKRLEVFSETMQEDIEECEAALAPAFDDEPFNLPVDEM